MSGGELEQYEIRIGRDPSGDWIWNVNQIESGFASTVDDAFARAKLALRKHRRFLGLS